MQKEYIIKAKTGLMIEAKKDSLIEVIDIEGGQVVDFFAINKDNHDEFLSTGVTLDVNEKLRISTNDKIYTNMYNEMFEIIEDDVKEHDIIHPSCRKEMYDFFYENGENHANCLDNINKALNEKMILARNEITPFNIFMHSSFDKNGNFEVKAPLSKAADKIVLKAKLDVILAIAACSVSESDCNAGGCTPVKIVIK